MSGRFEARHGLIKVRVKIWGPDGETTLRLAVDTGATDTLINPAPLVMLGYDLVTQRNHVEVTTGSGVEYAARIVLERIEALEQERIAFRVLCHTLPPSANIDGLLGLDFFRGQHLAIDFRAGEISLR